jgi:hypothetical protein
MTLLIGCGRLWKAMQSRREHKGIERAQPVKNVA